MERKPQSEVPRKTQTNKYVKSSTRTFICVFMLAAHETRKLKRDMQTVDGHVKHYTAVPPLSFLHLPKSEDQKTDIQEGSELDFN